MPMERMSMRLARECLRLKGTGISMREVALALVSFRVPPTPFREPAYTKGPGHCCVCGQPIFRFGWHRDLWGDRRPNQNATWHSCCVAAWNLWIAPSDHVRHLKVFRSAAVSQPANGCSRMPRSITTFPCSRSGTSIAIDSGLHCWLSGCPEPAGHQSFRSRGEVRPRGGRAQAP